MLVPEALGLKFLLVVLLVDLLEDVLEATIVFLQDSVLGAHVQRQVLHQGHLEAGVGKATDGVIRVVLGLGNTTAWVVEDLDGLGLAVGGGVDQLELTRARDHPVGSTVLVTKGVTTNDNGLVPAWDETGDGGDDDGLTEDSTTAADR